ncbi:sulfotransferase 1B1-like isoform X1 [Mytilus trossulus]|uniref:sulfotransferase 1B1-like isoform X1 n=1 Tax=Mytilus trossulus TaxID=6551 RepID=UPI003004DB56
MNYIMLKTFVADGDLAGSITVKEYEGRYFPAHFPDIHSHWKFMQSFEANENDVIICSYPKSGFHWIWEVVTMLLNNTSVITKELPAKYLLEMGALRKVQQSPPPRDFGSHLYYKELPVSIRQKKCKIINVIRDPRAVAVSSFHFYTKLKDSDWKGTWAGYLNLFLDGKVLFNDWFQHAKLWESVRKNNPYNPIHVLSYEDARKNPFHEFKRLARFLEVDVKDSMIMTIAEQTKFSNMKSSKEATIGHRFKDVFSGNKYPLYRKGTEDDWKSYFTLQQNAEFEQIYKERMKYNKLQLKSSINPGCLDSGCVETTRYESKL